METPRHQSNSEYHYLYSSSQNARAKLRRSKGKQPRPQVKVPKSVLSAMKEVEFLGHRGGWLRSSHSFKDSVTAHSSRDSAPKMIGAKYSTETEDVYVFTYTW